MTFIVAPIHVTHLIVLALRGYKHEITVYIQPLMSLFPLHRSLPLSDKTVGSTVALGECRFWTRGVADETWVLVERTRDSGLGILRVFRIWYNNNLVASFFFFFTSPSPKALPQFSITSPKAFSECSGCWLVLLLWCCTTSDIEGFAVGGCSRGKRRIGSSACGVRPASG